ncbi:MotE family protein [Geminicoccus roseus]|uniref:MotE family protein n=1 Tax=Geminicoccus roseus TaxID=404900 RepID=UPI0003FE5E8F|nr:hypothetical protein [Geminicoccus roseus]
MRFRWFLMIAAILGGGVVCWTMPVPYPAIPELGSVTLDEIEPAAGDANAGPARMPDLLAVAAQEVEAQRAALEEREQELSAREEMLRALARRLQAQLAELQGRTRTIEAGQALLVREQQERAERLARLYETMKPKRAATIFDQTPTEDVAAIARRMRDGKAALVIQHMSPDRASALSARLAEP